MKKLIAYFLILFLLNSCKIYEEIYNENLLYGTWVCTEVNSSPLPVNKNFVFKFNNTRTGLYALGVTELVESPTWIENTNIVYALRGSVLVLTFRTAKGVEQVMELQIHSLTATTLVYNVLNYKIEGVDRSDKNLYTLTKTNAEIDSQMVGYWQGQLAGYHTYFIWRFKNDGTYDFYEYDNETKKYVYQSPKPCQYKLYGNFLTCIYNNDVTKPEKGGMFECWWVQIESQTKMSWETTGKHLDLHRINGLPAEIQ